ncbi:MULTISPECIES: two-component system histidine kinase PnpS [Mesobacillus]|uniref:two-component system histidine kinase PnpS n=1 Tax=Mesobacillus TaxID=2675231 RepID=UPI00177F1BEB|nr:MULTISPECIES: ATP-binding protein [Mesobacillus]MCM3572162.1 cell wall metabolism sensor histidine kinase WalK [Mesobacillus subterraneus]UYZ21023.1 cell wall metabolism sensor histidine kinase WalK [Mesobacillus jeotgali]
MTKYRTRLLFALITLIIIVLIGLGLLLGQLFKNYYINSFNERLKIEINLLTSNIEQNGGLASLDNEEISRMSDLLNARITIVDLEGDIQHDTGELSSTKINRHRDIIGDIVEDKPSEQSDLEVGGGFDLHYYWNPLLHDGNKEGYVFLTTKIDELQKAYRQIWWILTISLGMALVVIILLGTRITNRYTKPIESATNVAIELAKGNYRARTYEDHIDETGMLSSSINILARNLQELMKLKESQQDRLTTLIENMGSGLILIDSRGYINLINKPYKEIFNVESAEYLYKLYYEVIEHEEISHMVEEIFMTEQKVRKQVVLPMEIERRHFEVYGVPIIGTNNVWKGILLVFHDITELKKLEQIRKDFVANVSHELKTPITSIKGFSETLLDGAMNDKAALEAFLEIILKESDRLQLLIQELLDLSKIEQQGFRLTIGEVDLIKEANEVIEILKGKAAQKDILLKLGQSGDSAVIEGDADRLKQVLINLVSNAITYTPNGGRVEITLSGQEDSVSVVVKDSGIGIEKSEITRIFERFYRVDRARSRNSGGTGLGLAIVKHIVEAHKGHIEVDSQIGKGTTFTIKLFKKLPQ